MEGIGGREIDRDGDFGDSFFAGVDEVRIDLGL